MNSLAIQPRWQAVVERWLAFLVTQRRLKPAAEGYQVCAGEEREDEHPHFSGHDLTLSQILRGARKRTVVTERRAVVAGKAWPLTIRPAPRIFRNWRQFCQQLAQRLQRPVRLLEVGNPHWPRRRNSLLAQLNAGQIEYVGLEQSQEMLLSAGRGSPPWPGARLSLWNADTLAAHAHSADIIWLNNALHRLLPEDPGLLATLQQLAVPGALLYVMEFRQLTPSALLSTLLLTNGQPEGLAA